jgi:hypothetical protein
MSFEQWMAELRKIAAPYMEQGQITEEYLDPRSWQDYFEDGYTPAGAWSDDMSHRKN